MTLSSVEKAWFVLSIAALAFGYGFASHAWDLFPKSYLVQAWDQAESLTTNPDLKKRVYDRSGVRIEDAERIQPGFTLITSWWTWPESDGLQPGAKLIDRKGRTVHQWRPNRSTLFEGEDVKGDIERADFDGSYLFPNGDLLLVFQYIGAVRVDACGNVLWRLKEGAHHYFSRADDGTFWMPGTSSERGTATPQYPDGLPGITNPVWFDQLLHVTEDGDLLDTINVLDLLYQNGLERHIVKAVGAYAEEIGDDPVHLNDVEPLSSTLADEYPLFEAGDLLISLRHPSLVLVFDPASRTVKWHASHPFLHQHDPDFLGNGWIGVFDNNEDVTDRGTMLGGSRIVAIQPHTDSVDVRFPKPDSDSFYTSVQGQWQLLDNGNMLLTESTAGRVVEVGADGRTVWEWIHEPYGTSQVPVVTGAQRVGLSRADVASWDCATVDASDTSSPK